MKWLARMLIAVGIAAMLSGIAGFCYILFVYPTEDPPFQRASGNLLGGDAASRAAVAPADGFARIGVRYRYATDVFVNRVLSAPHYHVRYDLRVDDADGGGRVFEESAHLRPALTFTHHVDLTPEGAAVTGIAAEYVSVGGDAEQHLTAFPVRAGQRLVASFELPEIETPSDAPMGSVETNVGSAEPKELFLLVGDYDPRARLAFRADGPTTALQAAGVGLLLAIVGGVMVSRTKT